MLLNQLVIQSKNTCESLTKILTETSKEKNLALEYLNNKLLETMNDREISVSYLLTPLSKITNPENSSRFKIVKESSSNRVNDFRIQNTIPITLCKKLLTFLDTNKQFELKGDFLKKITKKLYGCSS